jgi:ectoine hydroxylase-related dioxygenase (phytanoyl-CoA dioxygenase family)
MTLMDVQQRVLPSATTDRARAFADLDAFGYCVIADALAPAQVAALRQRLIDQAQGEAASGEASFDSHGANQRVWMLVNKGRMFRDLVISPVILEVMPHLLGPDFLLSSLTANIARPGGEAQILHSDQGYFGWTPQPMVANMAWMLDDFTDENGGTRLVPGSHLRPRQPGDTPERTVAAEGKAGSVLVFDGRMIHGTGANRSTGAHRHALLSYCCRPFVRQQENFYFGLAPELRTSEREALLERLGFRMYGGLGRTGKPGDRGLIKPVEHPVPALGPGGAAAADADSPLP